MVQGVLPIDLKHLAVTGCSYAGKMAIFAGAFDERIALTIASRVGWRRLYHLALFGRNKQIRSVET